MTAPRPRAVVIGSLALFVVLFAVLTFELSAAANTPAGKTRAAAKARPADATTEPATEPEEPAVEYVEPEPEYEYIEPEVEEIPPVVTSSS